MLEHLPDITLGNLRMRTLRAKKIRMLFGEGGVGIDKIKQVTFSVYDISSLNINQIQSVIKNVTLAERTPEVPNTNHVTSVMNRDDQINTPLISAEVTTSHPPIPRTNPTYDRAYFRNKTLDQYPNLYREFSSEDFDYYRINDKTLCPLCKLDHDDEEGDFITYFFSQENFGDFINISCRISYQTIRIIKLIRSRKTRTTLKNGIYLGDGSMDVSLGLEQTKEDKLQIYLIKNQKEREELYSALISRKTNESKLSLLKSFLDNMSDEHQGKPLRRNDWSTRT
ncbi:hypothetical protein C1645_746113 [Glomus cerebriforme]|uniref:Uncharacterized protein n=1 Tax=Glomus cerebriforme TaxID=658196 RepID=A0A397RY04_9GLOM|nr:hypothetical protein C1645_746113 [Glomus cerebriforme]